MKRFFAYGCSYTKWDYPTWSDFIGINFDEYYNRGRGGCDNTYILDKIHNDFSTFKFDPLNDTIFVAITGVNRLTWYNNRNFYTVGDLYNWQESIKQAGLHDSKKLDGFFELIWNLDWACIRSAQAIIQIKRFLKLLGINHVIFQGLDSTFLLDIYLNLNELTMYKIKEAVDIVNYQTPLDSFKYHDGFQTQDNENGIDGHPSIMKHYAYVKEFWPQYINDKTEKFYNETFEDFFLPVYNSRKERSDTYINYLEKKYPHFISYSER